MLARLSHIFLLCLGSYMVWELLNTSAKVLAMEKLQSAERSIKLSYGTLWVQQWFTESHKDETPVIFIHGGPGFSSQGIINLTILGNDFPCIFYDQSGCGNSLIKDDTVINWTLEHYEQELAELIDKLAYEKVILYGYSWGAALAVKYTSMYKPRVEKLILASPYLSTQHLLENYKKFAQSIGVYEVMAEHEHKRTTDSLAYQEAYELFFKNFICRQSNLISHGFSINKEISGTMWGEHELSVTGSLKDMNLLPLLSDIDVPVLLTSGKFDTMTPEYMQMLSKSIPQTTHVMFENSAHMPHLEEQSAYCQMLREFVLNKQVMAEKK